jgi:hypothetical protein
MGLLMSVGGGPLLALVGTVWMVMTPHVRSCLCPTCSDQR